MEDKHFVKFADGLVIEVSVPQINDLVETQESKSNIPFAGAKETADTLDMIVNPLEGYKTTVKKTEKTTEKSLDDFLSKFAAGIGDKIKEIGKEKLQASEASMEFNLGIDLGGNFTLITAKLSGSMKISFKWNFDKKTV